MIKKWSAISFFFISTLCAADNPLELIPEYLELAQKRMEVSKSKELPEKELAIMKAAADKIAIDLPSPGLKVGDQAPDFELKDSDGQMIKLSDKLLNGPVVLCFFRGSWCPYCNIEILVLAQSLPLFKKLNAKLITVSPQTVEKSKQLKEKFPGSFNILADLDYTVSKQYNVYCETPVELLALYKDRFKLDFEEYNGKGRTALPIAGTFVISKEGKIVATFCDSDYRKRMEPTDILIALSKLPRPAKKKQQ